MATKKATPRKAVKKTAKRVSKTRTAQTMAQESFDKSVAAETAVNARPLSEEALDRLSRDLNAMKEGEAQSNISVLRAIEVINLKNLNMKDRFAILCMLDNEGYIASDTLAGTTSNPESLLFYLSQEFLGLQHNNKFVRVCNEHDAAISNAVSKAQVRLEAYIGFDRPEPLYPETMQMGSAQYVRVQ